jgi:hypothetical protein
MASDSKKVKREKRAALKQPFTAIEPILNLLKNEAHLEETEIATRMGFVSPYYLQTLRKEGVVTPITIMAAKGLLAEIRGADLKQAARAVNGHHVTGLPVNFEDCELLFEAAGRMKKVRPPEAEKYKKLQSRIALHMASASDD